MQQISIILLFSVIALSSCQKASLPVVNTVAVTSINQTNAYSGGQVTKDGNAFISSRGVCWNTSVDPTISNNKTRDSTGIGAFVSYMTGLLPSTLYYVRAYATNSEGTSYGETVSFTTDDVAIPTLSTFGLKSVTGSTALCSGVIVNDGGLAVSERGICWNTTSFPSISDDHTSNGTGDGEFNGTLTGLTMGVRYYVRAYATNSMGTAYGNEVNFTQSEPVTDNDGNIYSVITIGTQIWMGENLKTTKFSDGTAITNITAGNIWANSTIPAYCWFNNDALTYKVPYGALYNWYAVNTGKLCPTGWHVATDDEYTVLVNYAGGETVAGGKLKEAGTKHWIAPNLCAPVVTGFAALPGGGRYTIYSEGGSFSDFGYHGYLWTATEKTPTTALSRDMAFDLYVVQKDEYSKSDGASVRCIKNTP